MSPPILPTQYLSKGRLGWRNRKTIKARLRGLTPVQAFLILAGIAIFGSLSLGIWVAYRHGPDQVKRGLRNVQNTLQNMDNSFVDSLNNHVNHFKRQAERHAHKRINSLKNDEGGLQ